MAEQKTDKKPYDIAEFAFFMANLIATQVEEAYESEEDESEEDKYLPHWSAKGATGWFRIPKPGQADLLGSFLPRYAELRAVSDEFDPIKYSPLWRFTTLHQFMQHVVKASGVAFPEITRIHLGCDYTGTTEFEKRLTVLWWAEDQDVIHQETEDALLDLD